MCGISDVCDESAVRPTSLGSRLCVSSSAADSRSSAKRYRRHWVFGPSSTCRYSITSSVRSIIVSQGATVVSGIGVVCAENNARTTVLALAFCGVLTNQVQITISHQPISFGTLAIMQQNETERNSPRTRQSWSCRFWSKRVRLVTTAGFGLGRFVSSRATHVPYCVFFRL